MSGQKPKPSPCYLDNLEMFRVIDGRQVWRDIKKSRFYTWDSLHGEIEIFNKFGYHIGPADALTGELTGKAVKGRKINIK